MDTLRKLSLTALMCYITIIQSVAQDADKVALAFSESYAMEYNYDYNGAIKKMSSVFDKNSYEINLRLGWLSYLSAMYKESVNYYSLAIALRPMSIESRLAIVNPYAALNSWDEVVKQYQKILDIDPKNSTVNYKLGMIQYNRKDYQNAFKSFEKVVNLYPFGYDALLMFAWSNYQLGKLKEAKLLFQKVIWLSPTDASAWEGVGLIK